ncbi:MAG: hypothetical protein Q8L14_09380 [Myxococcales bacterium]|nr:hypothetical protein [Myxococcales bacterium]
MRFVWWVGLFWATPSWGLPALDQARAELRALDYPAAEKALKAAATATGLTRAEALEFYELKALTAAGLNRMAEAREAFTTLLSLDPTFKLKGKPAPRITTTFFEARSAAREHGALEARVTTQPTSGRVGPVQVKVSDAARLVRTVVAELEAEGVTRSVELPPTGGTIDATGRTVRVRVTLKGERDWVLSTLEPIGFEAPAMPAVVTPTTASPTISEPVVVAAPRFRPLAYTLAGVGIATLATAVIFGVQAQNARVALQGTELTRTQALALAPQAVQNATIANVLMIAGGVLVTSGVVTFLLGLPPPPVAIVPTASGVLVAGGFSW